MSSGRPASLGDQESRVLEAFQQHYRLTFNRTDLLKLALTHRSYLSVTGQGPRDSNERLEFLGDSVLGLVTSEFLYRENPTEHEGQLTKTKSLLVSKAILSRRALAMGLGRFVLMSHSEVESGGRQRLSIIADAFESVVGAIYLDQGFEAARGFIHRWLLRDSSEIVADKRHTNYKSHLQEYVQSTFHTHPVYRIRAEAGPDHSKHFQVEVMVGKRVLGEGRGRNKKEAEQAAARDALEPLDAGPENRERRPRVSGDPPAESPVQDPPSPVATASGPTAEDAAPEFQRRGRRSGRRPRAGEVPTLAERPAEFEPRAERTREAQVPLTITPAPFARIALPDGAEVPEERAPEIEPPPPPHLEDVIDELVRPEGPLEERHIDPYAFEPEPGAGARDAFWDDRPAEVEDTPIRSDVGGGAPAPAEHPVSSDEVRDPARAEVPEPAEPQRRTPRQTVAPEDASKAPHAASFGRRGRRRSRR